MKIYATNNINSKTTILEYKSGHKKAIPMQAYSIQSDKADEFVTKYNNQASKLAQITAFLSVSGGVAGWFTSYKNYKSKIFTGTAGALSGFLISSYIACKLNEHLMDKYGVKHIQK